jgi:hypothetical protein
MEKSGINGIRRSALETQAYSLNFSTISLLLERDTGISLGSDTDLRLYPLLSPEIEYLEALMR